MTLMMALMTKRMTTKLTMVLTMLVTMFGTVLCEKDVAVAVIGGESSVFVRSTNFQAV